MATAFYFDMTSCIGCKACQMACKDKNDLAVGTLFRHVDGYETGSYPMPGVYYMSATCNHCENPACVANCPTGAMYKTPGGPVLHDDELCLGCDTCVQACPYGVPVLLPDKNIVGKCDTCIAIRANGNQPQCVAACPMRALEFGELEDLMKAHPDAVSILELPFMPESDTVPTTIVTPKKIVSKDAVQKYF
jgi:anaerobic dimethyl sulfoxide reductase subunit B (iron-sulfur subunit)